MSIEETLRGIDESVDRVALELENANDIAILALKLRYSGLTARPEGYEKCRKQIEDLEQEIDFRRH